MPQQVSDLPLREPDDHAVRESLIDLDASLAGGDLSQFVSTDTTIRPRPKSAGETDDLARRRTQDWVFPLLAPTSADRAVLELKGSFSDTAVDGSDRLSTASLIDLDMSLVPGSFNARSSTPDSAATSAESDNRNPFYIETQTAHFDNAHRTATAAVHRSTEDTSKPENKSPRDTLIVPGEAAAYEMPQRISDASSITVHDGPLQIGNAASTMPVAPLPPDANMLQGFGSREEMKSELRRMADSLGVHLQVFQGVLTDLPQRPPQRPARQD